MSARIIDCVTHISETEDHVVGWGPRWLAEDLIGQMDAPRAVLGQPGRISQAIVFPALGHTVPTSGLTFQEQHRYVVDSVRAHRDRLVGGLVVHARLWSDDVADYVAGLVRDDGFRMLYIHPSLHKYWLPIETPSESERSKKMLYPVFEAARALNIPIYIHTGEPPYSIPATVDSVATTFHDVPIILGHLGTQGVVYTLDAVAMGRHHDNIFLETSWGHCHMIIEAVNALGADRLIFGSNCPPNEPTQQLMFCEESLTLPPPVGAGIAPDQFQKILAGNLEQLLARASGSATR
jgi:predicted TIM-barrel fold metal-dependent hydrolase